MQATDAITPDDTTYAEQPDTPAPVFAARAIKSAIFGTPGIPDDPTVDNVAMAQEDDTKDITRTPQKAPQGILLTPGTGTSRRKRVSFDHQTVDKGEEGQGKPRRRGEKGSRISKLFGSQKSNDSSARRVRMGDSAIAQDTKTTVPTRRQVAEPVTQTESAEEEWEEEDDDDNHCMHDITLDLNEPHSRSGQYWKAEFQSYHEDAKRQMEQLVKYKELAKSYAKVKDAEAINLGNKLKEEQQKIATLERQIAEMAAQVKSKRRVGGDEQENADIMTDLAKQTALAVQYRGQVEELEALLGNNYNDDEPAASRRRRQLASPRTHKTLLETQRELRRARNQVKENGDLREQVKQLKAELRAAADRAAQHGHDGRSGRPSSSSEKELESLRTENRRLKDELESLKAEATKKDEDTKQVLEKATNKIADLKKENRMLKATSVTSGTEVKAIVSKTEEPVHTLRRLSDHGPKKSESEGHRKEHDKDGMDLMASLGKRLNQKPARSLRNKYKEDAGPATGPTSFEDIAKRLEEKRASPETPLPPKTSGNIVQDRIELEQPKWKPFIPRSPRNRDHLGSDLNQFIKQSSTVPTGQTPAPPRQKFMEVDLPHIDLLQDKFTSLGNPTYDTSTMLANATKSTLPPERRAAAIARIEQRKAERKRLTGNAVVGKENIAP